MTEDSVSEHTGMSGDTLLTSGSGHPVKKPLEPPPKSPKSKPKSRSKSRSRSKSKSPGKHKSKKSKSKNVKNFGWWDLENDPELIAALEAEGLREKARIAEDEALMARRQEIVRKFMQQHIDDMEDDEEEKRAVARTKGVAQRFLQQVQQKEREAKPVVLKTVQAAPLKIDVSKWEAPKYKKDADEKALIKNYTKKHFLFKDRKDYMKQLSTTRSQKSNLNTGIASNTVAMMIKAFEPIKVDKGEAIIQQGTLDQHLYVIDNGQVEFQVDDATVATGGAGTAFGDQNLLHAEPAKKTVIATEDTKVFRLHQDTYRCILQQRHIVEDLKRQQQEKEKERAKEKSVREKERKEKQLSNIRESDDSKLEEKDDKDVRIEKAKAKEIEESKLEEEEGEWWKDEKSAQLQLAIRDALQKVEQDELERIRVLGEGQFGEVWLVAANLDIEEDDDEEDSKRYEFALKLQDTYDEYRQETALSEIKVMKEVSGYPFVSMLYRSYETEESKDMVLGLIPGGELWDTIHQEDEETGEWLSGLSEGQSRFYALLVADTLDYLHSKHWVFRDLKPENIMLDGWGYPIIVDFGFCKRLPKGPNDKTFTFCGTPNYVSPEIVLNVGHNGAADCWALGIVIYEMIAGINPFFWDDMDQVELYRSICEDAGEPLNEKHHSRQVRKLVDALLVKDPDKRMNAKGILKHSWFEGLSLQKMRKRQVRAPWIPPGGEGETAEYYCDYTEDEATAAERKREQEIEEELKMLKKKEEEERRAHEEERKRMEEEEELERLRLLAEEQERLEEEERLRKAEERRLQEELEKLKKLEEELRLQKEEEERLQKEAELQRQRELEEERLRAEEERLRIEEEERLRKEEEERLRLEEEERLREEEEERLRQEEEERIRMEEEQLRIEEEERLRVEEELRLQRELEEERRQEEEQRMRKLEELRLEREEKEKKKREKEERKREKELRRQKRLEEKAKQKEEEERQRQLEEEEERLRQELEEEQRKLEEEERRQREITLQRRREMNELEREIEEKEQEDQQRRLHEEEQRQREVAARRRQRLEAETQKHERKVNKEEKAWRHRRQNIDDKGFLAQKVNSWEQSPVRRPNRSFRNMADVSPVPKGYVSKSIEEYATRSPRKEMSQSPGAMDVRKSVKRGIVAQRLNEAKRKEDPANVPSMFASFSLLEKNKKDRRR